MKSDQAKRKWVKGIINKWRGRVFLGEWHIDVAYEKEDLAMQPGGRPMATCWADPVYMIATITIYPCFWNAPTDRRIHGLVHEMVHCQTQSVWNCMNALHSGELITPAQSRCEIEQLTQRIANMVYQQEWE